jgi:hypothetical protein
MRHTPIVVLSIGLSAFGCGRVAPDSLATAPVDSLPPSSSADAVPIEHETSGDADIAASDVASEIASDVASDVATSEPTDLEVSSAGDDTHGDGTHEHPFKTIGRAIAAAAATKAARFVTMLATEPDTTFGDGCSGGPPCDTTPIVVPALLGHPLTIRSTPGDSVIVTGGGESVFRVEAPGIGFAGLTIRPTKIGMKGSGGHGIVYAAPAASPTGWAEADSEGTIVDVRIEGISTYAWEAASGNGIWFPPGGAAGPTIGPGVKLTRGWRGIVVEGNARPRIVSDTSASPSGAIDIGKMTDGCIVMDNPGGSGVPSLETYAKAGSARDIHLHECVRAGVTLHVSSPLSKASLANLDVHTNVDGFGVVIGNQQHASITDSTLAGGRVGAFIADDAVVTFDSVDVSYAMLDDVQVVSHARLVSRSSTYTHAGADGIHFDGGSLQLQDSKLLDNGWNGLWLSHFVGVDLGSDVDAPANVFNETSHKNGRSGLCLTNHDPAKVANGVFSCNHTAAVCSTDETPTKENTTDGICYLAVDVSLPDGVSLTFVGAKCCD